MIWYLKALEHLLDSILASAPRQPVEALLRAIRFLNRAVIGFYRDNGWSMAAALSFSGSLAIIPTSALYFSLFSAFGSFQNSILKIRELLIRHMLPESAVKSSIEEVFVQITQKVYGITFFSLISVMVTTVILYVTIEYTLNHIFMVRRDPPLIRSLIVCTSLMFWGPILLGISGYMFLMAGQFPWVKNFDHTWVNHIMTFGVSWLLFFLSYYLLPYANIGLFPCLLGGAIAAGLWEISKLGFSLYLSNVFYLQVYGTLAFIPLSLVWLYFFWAIFLYGAEIAFHYHSGTRRMIGKEAEHDVILVAQSALASLLVIGRSFRAGRTPPDIHHLAHKLDVPAHIVQDGLLALEQRGLLISINRMMDTFVPCRPLDQIRVEDAFWAVFPARAQMEEASQEMASVAILLDQMRLGITEILRGESIDHLLDRLRDQDPPPIRSLASLGPDR